MKKIDSKLSKLVQQILSLVGLILLGLLVSCGGGASSFELVVQENAAVDNTGKGIVTSDLGSIDCGNTCQDSFTDGTSITLTATSSDNSLFVGWEGCDSNPTENTCVVVMSATKVVFANFKEIPAIPNLQGFWYNSGGSPEVITIFQTGENAVAFEGTVGTDVPTDTDEITWRANVVTKIGEAKILQSGSTSPRFVPGTLNIIDESNMIFTILPVSEINYAGEVNVFARIP